MRIQMKRSKLQTIVQILALFCAILIAGPSDAEENSKAEENPETPILGPINSDPLTIRGISPRVLDIGRNWTLTCMAGLNGTRTQATVNFGYRW